MSKFVLLKDTTRRPEWGSNRYNLCLVIIIRQYNIQMYELRREKTCHRYFRLQLPEVMILETFTPQGSVVYALQP